MPHLLDAQSYGLVSSCVAGVECQHNVWCTGWLEVQNG